MGDTTSSVTTLSVTTSSVTVSTEEDTIDTTSSVTIEETVSTEDSTNEEDTSKSFFEDPTTTYMIIGVFGVLLCIVLLICYRNCVTRTGKRKDGNSNALSSPRLSKDRDTLISL